MAGCPYCHTPVRNDAKFCHSCGANLLLPEFDRAFCSQCGARVRSRQWFCQKCQSPLENDSEENPLEEQIFSLKEPALPALVTPEKPPQRPEKPPQRRNSWIGGLVISLMVILALVWMIRWRSSSAPSPPIPQHIAVEKPTHPASLANQIPPDVSQPPKESKLAANLASKADRTGLQTQVAAVLNNLRDAQLEKNLSKFLKSYASTFPGLDKKQQKTLAVWKKYDYLALHYDLQDLSVLDPETLTAKVSWDLETMNRVTREKERSTLAYTVWFSREDGGWRIKKLAPVHSP